MTGKKQEALRTAIRDLEARGIARIVTPAEPLPPDVLLQAHVLPSTIHATTYTLLAPLPQGSAAEGGSE